MLLEAKPFRIEPQQQQRLREIAQRVFDVIENWKSKQAQRMSMQGGDSREMYHQLKRYINSQRGGKLLIGKITAIDNSLKRERTYNVLITTDDKVDGYFDDEYSAAEMLQIRNTALRSGEAYTSKRFRVSVDTIRRALRIPEEIITGVPARYMGRGEIVLSMALIQRGAQLPRIAEVLTHEFTHAVQHYKEPSTSYNVAAYKAENLTPEEWEDYITEPLEFEAQLRGLIEYIEMRYKELSDVKHITDNLTEVEIYKKTGLLGDDGVQALIEQNKKQYKQTITDTILNASAATCQYMHQHMDEIIERGEELLRLCNTRKFKHQEACNQYRELRKKYPLLNSEYNRFICAASTSPRYWRKLKQAVAYSISNL